MERCKNCKHSSDYWCLRRKKSINPRKDWCSDYAPDVKVDYQMEAKLGTSW